MAQSGGFGGFGGFGSSANFTGLGGFLGAEDAGSYDHMTAAGMQMAAEGLRHLTLNADSPNEAELEMGALSNLDQWAVWVRGSLYVSEFLSGLSYAIDPDARTVTLEIDGRPTATLAKPKSETLRRQCRIVSDYAALRPDRSAEITSQLGFPTAYFAMILGLNAAQHARTFELITATQVVAAHVAMILKQALAVRRPDQLDAKILPMIPTPGHGSYPSAHATEAYAVATVLTRLIGSWKSLSDNDARQMAMSGLAERIAVNRTVAGVHYPIDSWAGAALGRMVGETVLARANVSNSSVTAVAYDPEAARTPNEPGAADFFDSDFAASDTAENYGLRTVGTNVLKDRPAFSWLWAKAAGEHQGGT